MLYEGIKTVHRLPVPEPVELILKEEAKARKAAS
jgi:hypothetical protein